MFSEQDQAWLRERYPDLTHDDGTIAGTINLRAAFDQVTNQFQIMYPREANLVGGCELAGTFKISMQPCPAGAVPRIPSVIIDGYPYNKNRHISHDGTACLCSPFIEGEYLTPELDGRRFIEELVVPFLYGQLYYDEHSSWPWPDYSHGLAGLMESYTPVRSEKELLERLSLMVVYPSEWAKVHKLICQRKAPNASSPCVCGSSRRMGHCHPLALKGLLAMRDDRKKYRK